MPEKSENAALVLRLGLQSTRIRPKKGAFRKTLLKREEFKNAGFAFFGWTGNNLENDAFRKR